MTAKNEHKKTYEIVKGAHATVELGEVAESTRKVVLALPDDWLKSDRKKEISTNIIKAVQDVLSKDGIPHQIVQIAANKNTYEINAADHEYQAYIRISDMMKYLEDKGLDEVHYIPGHLNTIRQLFEQTMPAEPESLGSEALTEKLEKLSRPNASLNHRAVQARTKVRAELMKNMDGLGITLDLSAKEKIIERLIDMTELAWQELSSPSPEIKENGKHSLKTVLKVDLAPQLGAAPEDRQEAFLDKAISAVYYMVGETLTQTQRQR